LWWYLQRNGQWLANFSWHLGRCNAYIADLKFIILLCDQFLCEYVRKYGLWT
jgi:hypothetical protein